MQTWKELREFHCSRRNYTHPGGKIEPNMFYEDFATRRFNYSPSLDTSACRLVFLKDVLKNKDNKTLCRGGRFIWCRNFRYEGRSDRGLRSISFTVDQGRKRFTIDEDNILCIPAKIFVSSSPYFRNPAKTFLPFSSVFSYKNALRMLEKSHEKGLRPLAEALQHDNPYKSGTLVRARCGYFYPEHSEGPAVDYSAFHPYGIIIGPSFENSDVGREFYRVRFAGTTYERVHPVQLEIVNEV